MEVYHKIEAKKMVHTNKHKGNSTVALIRSSAKNATQISDLEVRQMVRDVVQLTGGFSDIIKDGEFVVIKPNLVTTRATAGTICALTMLMTDPYKKNQVPQTVNGITPDIRIAKALVELVREINPSGKVYIMECSGEGHVKEAYNRLGYTHENMPGVDKFVGLDETGDGYRAIDSEDLVAVDLKEKQQYKKLPKFLNNRYYFDKTYYSADVVISLCCLKNHMNAAITGGIKNVGIGVMPGKIYGNSKKTINRGLTINHGWEPLNNFIHDYYIAKPVQFVLTDGLQGSAYGPHCQGAPSYEAVKMNMRLLLASKDPVACDSVHACIIGVDPEKINYLKDISRDGFGTIDTSKITVVGNARVDEVKKSFPMAKGVFGVMYNGPKKTKYTDFDPPEISVENVTVKDNKLAANLSVDSKTSKVEMHIDGKLVESFKGGFDQLQYPLNGRISKGSHEITFYAYDRFLNCGHKTTNFSQ